MNPTPTPEDVTDPYLPSRQLITIELDTLVRLQAAVRSLEERLGLAEKVVDAARHQEAISDYTSNSLLLAVMQYDSAQALVISQVTEREEENE